MATKTEQAVHPERQAEPIVRELPPESFFIGMKNRILALLARVIPGPFTWRVRIHRLRGVKLGSRVHIAPDVIIETAYPHWVSIGSNVQLGIRCTILAHIHGLPPLKDQEDLTSVRIEDDVYIGPGAIVCPNVTIGRGAVVAAGSVITRSVAPMTLVRGNPAEPVAHCGVALTWDMPYKEFLRHLKPLR